jgi:hypothetical protein
LDPRRHHQTKHTQVIQRIQNQPETSYPLDIIRTLLDVPMPSVDVNTGRRVEMPGRGGCDERFGLADVGFAEEELTIQV